MDDRVLDERLEGEGRHGDLERGRVRVDLEPEAVAQAHALELEVAADEVPLARERHPVAAGLVDPLPEPQQLAQPLEGALRARRVAADETEQGVEHVEHEVRVELRAQELELGAGTQHVGRRPLARCASRRASAVCHA